jgi:hypothetical protein
MSQTIRESASNRRVSQDALLTNLTVSDNCVLPCLDDRIKSLISTQINNGVANPYLVKDTVVTRDELIATTPRLTGGQSVTSIPTAPPLVSGQTGGGGPLAAYAYPTQGNSPPSGAAVLPQPGVDVITLIPAPGPGLMIIPRIIEIKIPKDGSITNPAYTPKIRNDLIALPTPNPNYFLVFQLRDRYPVLVELKQNSALTWRVVPFGGNADTDGVIGPGLISNSGLAVSTTFGTPANNAIMSDEQQVFHITNGNEEGMFFDDDYESKNFNRTNRFQVNIPGVDNGFVAIQGTREVTTNFPLAGGPEGGYVGYSYSPVNQPLTMYMDQPLLPDRGRDFTVRVHYNIVPALD